MIAFSKDLLDDQRPTPVLIFGPQIAMAQTDTQPLSSDATACDQDLVATKVARHYQEMVMLQRALFRCGLIGQQD